MKRVAILGASGAVGQEMLKVLAEKRLPIEVVAMASKRSAGSKVTYGEKELTIVEATEDSFEGFDYVLGAVEAPLARMFTPSIKKAGAIFIDNSSAYRMDDEVPLVIPEINPKDAFDNPGIISSPNCSTIVALVAVNALNKVNPIKRMIVSTYQAVSGAGKEGVDELLLQEEALRANEPLKTSVFAYPIAHNLLAMIGDPSDHDYTNEELKMLNESRKILHNKELLVNCTCVRVPVLRCHSESITLEFDQPFTVEKAKEVLATAPGVILYDDIEQKQFPMPSLASDQDLIYVGRIRQDISLADNKGLVLWCCGDQVRKGAATNAVQILELLIK